MADTRNVTVTFDDGSSHNYQNVPKDVTPDQIEGRAQKEFSGKKIKNIAGDSGQSTENNPTLVDRVSSVGREALTGGIYGTFAPEMMQAAGGGIELLSQGLPGTIGRVGQLAGGALMAGGEAMRGSRAASAGAGLLGGITGESAGQIAESKVGPGLTAETARLLGATLGPVPIEALGTKTGRAIGSVLSRFGVPGMGTAKTVGQLLAEQNVKPENLTQFQKDFIAQKVNDIRGGKSSLNAQKEIADMLKTGAAKIELTGEQQASQLEQQAQQQSQKLISDAQIKAKNIRDNARSQSPAVRQIAEIEAKDALERGQQEANRIISESKQKVLDLRQKAGKLTTRSQQTKDEARKELTAVGTAQTPTQTGTSIRESVAPAFEKLKETRATNAEKNKGEAFGDALKAEAEDKRVKNTKAFQQAETQIIEALNNPQTGLSNAPVDTIRNQLMKVRQALNPKLDNANEPDISFEGLEKLRRFLRDRAYGLPAEGFDAISQQQAGKLADAVENIQKEFSPKFSKFLEQYRQDSQPLNLFKTKLGEAIVGKEEFDMGRFAHDPATLGSKFFKSETGVKDLVTLLGGDAAKAETIARGYIANKLENASAKDVENFLKSETNRDWLTQFPQLKQQLEQAAKTMSRAEGFGGAREKAASKAISEIGSVTTTAETLAQRLKDQAAKEAEKVSSERIKTQAKGLKGQKKLAVEQIKTAEQQAKEAEKPLLEQAKGIRSESQKTAQLITAGDTSGPDRIKDLVNSKNTKELGDVAKIIQSTPGGQEKFAEALSQVIADKIGTTGSNLNAVINDFKYIGDRLVENGLLKAEDSAKLAAKLQEVLVTPVDQKLKATMAQKLMRNALVGYFGEIPPRTVQSMTKQLDKDYAP